MNTVLYFSTRGVVYETRAYSKADIAELVHEQGLQCLTSSDRQFDFWFSPSMHRCQRRANQAATELLLATTDFTARSVPLLRGCVVVATHDADGDLDGLSWQQLDLLVAQCYIWTGPPTLLFEWHSWGPRLPKSNKVTSYRGVSLS